MTHNTDIFDQPILTLDGHPGHYKQHPNTTHPTGHHTYHQLNKHGYPNGHTITAPPNTAHPWEPEHPAWCNDRGDCQQATHNTYTHTGRAITGHIPADGGPAEPYNAPDFTTYLELTQLCDYDDQNHPEQIPVQLTVYLDGDETTAKITTTPDQLQHLAKTLNRYAQLAPYFIANGLPAPTHHKHPKKDRKNP